MSTPSVITLVALLALGAGTAQAQESLPKRKAGLWELTMQMKDQPGGMQPMKTQQCVDDKTDEAMQRKAMASSDPKHQCKQTSSKRIAGGLEIEMDCKGDDGSMHMVSRMTGDMNSNYTIDSRTTFKPPRNGMSEMQMTMKAAHAGACPAGMKPGDMRIGGMTFNPMQGGPGGAPGGAKGMSAEDIKKMMEEMKKAQGVK